MNKTVLLALLAGLAGGMATRYIAPPVAFAQDQSSVTKEIRAQSFTLVDSTDQVVGSFAAEPIPNRFRSIITNRGPNPTVQRVPEMRIVLRDSRGREIWSADSDPVRPLSQILK